MSYQSKIITIGLVLAFGIGNAYYTFNPALKELRDRREGISPTLQPQNQAAERQKDEQKPKPS